MIIFSRRISNLIKAMMSRMPQDALREYSSEYDVSSMHNVSLRELLTYPFSQNRVKHAG